MTPLRRLFFAGIVGMVGVAAGEAGARAFVYSAGQASIPDDQVRMHVAMGAMKYDALLGWTWSTLPQPQFNIDANGFRYGTPLLQGKRPGQIRAFTLGDSQTYGAGLEWNQTYAAVAETELRARGFDVQLINAAISGYGSLQALRLFENRLHVWNPDYLVVDCRPFDQPRETNVPHQVGVARLLDPILFNSKLYYLLRFSIELLRPDGAARMAPNAEADPARFGNHHLLIQRAARYGVSVIFLDYPFWDKNGNIRQLAPPEKLPIGAVIAPVTAALTASGIAPDQLFLDNNHLSVAGSAIVGRALADTLAPLFPMTAREGALP